MQRPRATNCVDEAHADISASKVRVFALRRPKPSSVETLVNTTSTAHSGLSPFNLGPIPLYDGHVALNMENAWQYSKVYAEHADADGNPTEAYWTWARAGWANPRAVRFPMGRGAKPLYSLWKGKRLGYIEARKEIYAPLYANAVAKTTAFKELKKLYDNCVATGKPLGLVDFDGWDHVGQGIPLADVINYPKPKMGHAFVLAGLLEGIHFWSEVAKK